MHDRTVHSYFDAAYGVRIGMALLQHKLVHYMQTTIPTKESSTSPCYLQFRNTCKSKHYLLPECITTSHLDQIYQL